MRIDAEHLGLADQLRDLVRGGERELLAEQEGFVRVRSRANDRNQKLARDVASDHEHVNPASLLAVVLCRIEELAEAHRRCVDIGAEEDRRSLDGFFLPEHRPARPSLFHFVDVPIPLHAFADAAA